MAPGDPTPPMGEAEEAMLNALFTQSPVGLHLLDTDLRVVRVNTATSAMRGVSPAALLGHRFSDAYDIIDADRHEAAVREVLETGVPLREWLVRARRKGGTAPPGYYAMSVFRLDNPGGQVLGLALSVVDVTRRERAFERLRVLDTVRERVGRTMDSVVTCDELVSTLVPEYAEVAVVELVDAVLRGDDPPLSPLPAGVPLLRAAYRNSRGPDQVQAHPVGAVLRLPGPTPFTQALADLRPRVIALESEPPWLATDPARAEAIIAGGVCSLLVVPLALHGSILGLVSLYRGRYLEPYDEDDIELALQMADHTALCIDNGRRFTREHTIASTVQRHLLPHRPATHTALETAYVPTATNGAGSWYDTISLSAARTALVIGNVAGHGIHATATMGQLRTVIRSLAAFDLPPDELLARLNDTATLLAAERASLPPSDPLHREALTAACVYAVYDPLTRMCTVARAGHLAPVIVRPDGTAETPDIPIGPPLGVTSGSPFTTCDVALEEGSILALSSSPVVAAHLAGHPGLLHRPPDAADPDAGADAGAGADPGADAGPPLADLCDDVLYSLPTALAGRAGALLLARTRPFPADRVASWELEPEPAAVCAARHHAGEQLAAWGIEGDTVFNTELIVSELVTNAIRHGAPPLALRLINDRTLTCEVRDAGPAAPRLRHARTVDEGGRGLFITSQLAQAWGTRYDAEGKTIWTEQPLPPRPS
ncbi:SpoIIE family protein phosphatase [Streptomyces sp. NPDC058691]|uniref:SpoIIE family protein phosphatase n=1 Tax=Streptomyces sp. NPDC058691 TaxID=3346601 RepID=UPI00365B9C8F